VTRLQAVRHGLNSRQGKWWDFSHLYRVQISFGAHPTCYPMCTGGSYPGVKWIGREADYSPPSSAEVNAWSCTSTKTFPWRDG